MELQFLHLPFTISPSTTFKTLSTIAYNLLSLLLTPLSHLHLFKPPPDSGHHVIIVNGPAPSLLRVPAHVVTDSIKNNVPITPYSGSNHRHTGAHMVVCVVCMDSIDDDQLIRELVNCEHVFHLECFDQWVDVGSVNCPLCRSMLLDHKKLLSVITTVTAS